MEKSEKLKPLIIIAHVNTFEEIEAAIEHLQNHKYCAWGVSNNKSNIDTDCKYAIVQVGSKKKAIFKVEKFELTEKVNDSEYKPEGWSNWNTEIDGTLIKWAILISRVLLFSFDNEINDTELIRINDQRQSLIRKYNGSNPKFKFLLDTSVSMPSVESDVEKMNKELGEREIEYSKKKKRDYKFKNKVLAAYDYKCAVCGSCLISREGYYELEAAHIQPVSESDQINDFTNNGIALCRLHHWAFDKGLFSLNDEFQVIIEDRIRKDPMYEMITKFENNKILLPNNQNDLPSKSYIKEHRKIWNFDSK